MTLGSSAISVDEYRRQNIDINAALKRVATRGGPIGQWRVNIGAGEASIGLCTVYFYLTNSGGFAPNSYFFLDGRDIESEEDCSRMDDAYACIAMAINQQE